MKATEYGKGIDPKTGEQFDGLAEYIGTEDGRAAIAAHDSHWEEVMRLAERHGFITQAYGGAAILCSNSAYLEANGAGALADRLRMQGVDL